MRWEFTCGRETVAFSEVRTPTGWTRWYSQQFGHVSHGKVGLDAYGHCHSYEQDDRGGGHSGGNGRKYGGHRDNEGARGVKGTLSTTLITSMESNMSAETRLIVTEVGRSDIKEGVK